MWEVLTEQTKGAPPILGVLSKDLLSSGNFWVIKFQGRHGNEHLQGESMQRRVRGHELRELRLWVLPCGLASLVERAAQTHKGVAQN